MIRARRRAARDRGSASLEFLGVLPILLLIALAGIQLGLVAYTASQAGTAARAAARAAALYDSDLTGPEAATGSVSDWLVMDEPSTTVDGDSVTVTVRIHIPSLVPGLPDRVITRAATMPMEDTEPVE